MSGTHAQNLGYDPGFRSGVRFDFGAQESTTRRASFRVQIDRAGVVRVAQTSSGGVPVCDTHSAMFIRTSAARMSIRNGRVCGPHEEPNMLLDTLSCAVIDGISYGILTMECSGRD